MISDFLQGMLKWEIVHVQSCGPDQRPIAGDVIGPRDEPLL